MRRGEIEGRLNPGFLGQHQSLLKQLKELRTIRRLGELIFEGAFGVLPPGDSYIEDGGIRFLRATEMREDNKIDWDNCLRVPINYADSERAKIKLGDVLIAVKGATIASGKSVCTINSLSEPTIVNGSIFRFQPTQETTSAFLYAVLTSSFVKQQMKSALILNNAVDYLSRNSIDELLVLLPDLDTQRKLVDELDIARDERMRKLVQASVLLAGMDVFVLGQLGLQFPGPVKRPLFTVSLGQVRRENTLNPDFFHPERLAALRAIQKGSNELRKVQLATVVSFMREQDVVNAGDNYIGLANVTLNTGEIITTAEEVGGQVFRFEEGDVLFGRLRPYLNKVYCAEKPGKCSTEFHVMRVNSGEEILPEFLALILRSTLILSQTKHMMTGNTHPRLTNDDVKNLVVPIPRDITQQQTIVQEFIRRRAEARRLREEAEAEWGAAKQRFEQQLLG